MDSLRAVARAGAGSQGPGDEPSGDHFEGQTARSNMAGAVLYPVADVVPASTNNVTVLST